MSQRGRPRNALPSIRVAIAGWLNPEYDADILAWLNSIPKGQRMNALKTVLRSGGLGQEQNTASTLPDESQNAANALLAHWEF
ncbi:MAG: hypothetical protein WCK35_14860 [Chloroflexota bacterium]|jgi:hypothetical protein